MTDGVRVAREALQAIIDNHAQDGRGTCGWCDSSARCPDFDNANAALVALEAAEAASVERDDKIREHAEAITTLDRDWRESGELHAARMEKHAEAILALLAAKTTTEPEACEACDANGECCHGCEATTEPVYESVQNEDGTWEEREVK